MQLIPKVSLSQLTANLDGTYTVSIPLDSFEDGWYPGLDKEGRFAIVNDTENEYALVGYDVVIQHSNGDYRMDYILCSANKAVCELYGWSGRETSTLAGLVNVEDKIKEVYENNSEYNQNYQYTYSDYLLYYYKTRYPDLYASIQSLNELSPTHQYEIFSQYNSTDDCWYDDGLGDSLGNLDLAEALNNGRLYSYQSGAKYGALELDHEVDQLAKAIAFHDGFLYSLDTTTTPIPSAPSLSEWAHQTEKAQKAFQAFAEQVMLAPRQNLRLNHLGFQLVGGAFSNCFQAVEWDYTVCLILQNQNEIKSYHVTYQFNNATNSDPLPPAVLQLLPIDPQAYLHGSTATAKEVAQTVIYDETGRWVFQGWDKQEQTSIQTDVVFTGTWIYIADVQAPVSDEEIDLPPTGDNGRLTLWLAALAVSACCLIGLTLKGKAKGKRS